MNVSFFRERIWTLRVNPFLFGAVVFLHYIFFFPELTFLEAARSV